MDLETLKYPIGKYTPPEPISDEQIKIWIGEIETLPKRLSDLVSTLNEEQLNTPYRPGGWTGKQVIHHLADSHMNAFIRFHLALTETNPTIKPYLENKWAELPYLKEVPIDISLSIITNVHARLIYLLKSLTTIDLEKTYVHPEYNKTFKLREVVGLYAWHGNHHLGHIKSIIK